MELTKQMIAEVQSLSLNEGLDYAASMNAKARGTDDCKKGIAAFLNKEKLNW
jgi:methylglutaconyl-CoA hydratase